MADRYVAARSTDARDAGASVNPAGLDAPFSSLHGSSFPAMNFARRILSIVRQVHGMRQASGDENRYSAGLLLERHAMARPHDIAIKWSFEQWTWKQFNDEANRIAAYFHAQGLKAGDCVALCMENSPEYLFLLVGLNKIGVVAALINPQLSGEPLVHSLRQSGAGHVIADDDLVRTVRAACAELGNESPVLLGVRDDARAIPSLWSLLPAFAGNPPETRRQRARDLMMYLYTSGTTGLPKAALIRNRRFLTMAHGFAGLLAQADENDTIYLTLPLYHATGAISAFGMALVSGASLALRRRFSVSEFWADCVQHEVTIFNYIGEVCRYLLASPPHPLERAHRVRLAVGAGLRADVWEPFRERFSIPRVVEFYGATEGNIGLANLEGKPGMIGRLLPGQAVARVDADTGDLLRDGQGRLIRARAGEQGMLLGRIGRRTPFDGYLDGKRTGEKVVRNAFGAGSDWFNSGDLVDLHPGRWVSFADRLGDTYRWKGENISTIEVSNLLNRCSGVIESCVYGVSVPDCEGRAGMAAMVVSDDFSLARFSDDVCRSAPVLLRPMFLRLCRALPKTASFKYVKTGLQREGFDPDVVTDPLYVYNPAGQCYEQLDPGYYARICSNGGRS